MNPNVYVLRADFGRYTDTFKKENYIGIGWFQNEPSSFDLTNKETLKEEYKKVYPGMGLKRGEHKGNMLINFHVEFPTILTAEQIDKLAAML